MHPYHIPSAKFLKHLQRPPVDRDRLRALHATGLTDVAIAKELRCHPTRVRQIRTALDLPVNHDAVRAARASSGAKGAFVRKANCIFATRELGLPSLPCSSLARQIVTALASGPRTQAELAVELNVPHTGRNSYLAKLCSALRKSNLISSRSVYGGPTFRRPSVWTLSPAVVASFPPNVLTPLQREVAAAPSALATAANVSRFYSRRAPGLALEFRSAAYDALVDAAKRFDPTVGPFIKFVLPRVHGAIKNTMRDSGPRGYRRNSDRPAVFGGAPADIVEMFDPAADSQPVGWELDSLDAFETLTRSLSKRDRLIMLLYYVHNLTMCQIGTKLGVSESCIAKLMTRAIANLRARLVA